MHGNGNGPPSEQDQLNQTPPHEAPEDLEMAEPDFQIDPRDVASAGRSCSAILILMVAIVVVLIGGIILRWIFLG
jgi:hypothetical protein